jgi:hypothetical protein
MSIRIVRTIVFAVDGDGSSSVITIDLREQLESKSLVGGYSPSGIDTAVLKSNRTGTTLTVSASSIADFLLTVSLAAALASDPGFGYTLTVGLLVEGVG